MLSSVLSYETEPMGVGRKLEETKRIGRVLRLVQLIHLRPRQYLRRDLAARFEVSQRQIDKDLELLRHGLVLPLRHSANGYYFDDVPSLPSLTLSFGEALALLLAAQTAGQVPGVDDHELDSAMTRVEGAFPPNLRHLLRRRRSVAGSPSYRHRAEVLAVLHKALAEGRKVSVVYATASRGGAVSERVVRPYSIIPVGRSWHLVAWCERRREVLLFKVDRVKALTVLGETYAVPEDWDVDAWLSESWGLIREPGRRPEEIELLFEPFAGRWVAEDSWHPRQRVETLADGRVRFRAFVPVTGDLVRWVLSYGGRVVVVAPESLRIAVVAEAKRTLAVALGEAEVGLPAQ